MDKLAMVNEHLINTMNLLNNLTINNRIADDDVLIELYCPRTMPNVYDYLTNLNLYLLILILLAGIVSILTLILFIIGARYIVHNQPNQMVTLTFAVYSIYPIVSTTSLISLIMPQTFLLMDGISVTLFSFCALFLIKLALLYVEGETQFISKANPNAFNELTMPFCCLLPFLKSYNVTKKRILNGKLLVFQMSIVMPLISVTQLILYLEDEMLFFDTTLYFLPFNIVTILLAIWGLNILIRMIAPYCPELKLRQRYLAVQVVLLCSKIQPAIAGLIVSQAYFPCYPPVTPYVLQNTIVQIIIIFQMFGLCIWAKSLYKTPTREQNTTL